MDPLMPLTAAPPLAREQALRSAARALEATFLAQMLEAAGLGAPSESFGGGAGEDQFASLLRMEQARLLADRGGLGLSEAIFDALKERAHDS
jgi:Rod binding domain-containing protein